MKFTISTLLLKLNPPYIKGCGSKSVYLQILYWLFSESIQICFCTLYHFCHNVIDMMLIFRRPNLHHSLNLNRLQVQDALVVVNKISSNFINEKIVHSKKEEVIEVGTQCTCADGLPASSYLFFGD